MRLPLARMATQTAKRVPVAVCFLAAALSVFATASKAQIASSVALDGRRLFINAEPPARIALSASKRPNIYLPREASFAGRSRPAVNLDRDGVDRIVREAADRHRVDAALIRAVIQTESNWNPRAYSNRGAGGLMQLIPTTAHRFGVNNVFDPQQNIDGGVHYLKTLLQRYNGNLDLALAAYNAGEGAVDRARGIPNFRETRNYVLKVQAAYFRPNSGRLGDALFNPRPIHKDVDNNGRVIFTND
jgi:soluble lytic murein transglycosylase-like protein